MTKSLFLRPGIDAAVLLGLSAAGLAASFKFAGLDNSATLELLLLEEAALPEAAQALDLAINHLESSARIWEHLSKALLVSSLMGAVATASLLWQCVNALRAAKRP
jgi:hypothetical protein